MLPAIVVKKSLKVPETSLGLEDKESLILRETQLEDAEEDIISRTPCHNLRRLPEL